uniref:Uncharacterized protein n=1 Tax=viral metagenome TaxID=1070528 RepID=A0A6M3JFP2_9ZZZZ
MITEEEKQEIIDKAVEKALLMLPEVVGNLMAQHVALSKVNSKFYADHPEFKEKKEIVASIVEKIEGENPLMKYEDLLDKAIPSIRQRIKDAGNLSTDIVPTTLDRNFTRGNGEI